MKTILATTNPTPIISKPAFARLLFAVIAVSLLFAFVSGCSQVPPAPDTSSAPAGSGSCH